MLSFRAVQHWLDLNGLSLNPDKTEAIVIGASTRKRMEGLVNTVNLGCVSVSPLSNDLHWLPVQYSIQYKLTV